MVEDREEFENGRMFNELCSINSSRPLPPPLTGRIKPNQPTTLYEQFKQSTFNEPQNSATSNKSNEKQVVTREEAQKLRDSVLKSTRPLNPYYERSLSSSPNSYVSPTSSNKSTTYLNNEKISTKPTPEVRSVPIIRTKMHSNTKDLTPRHDIPNFSSKPTPSPQKTRDLLYLDTFDDETPKTGLFTLSQLEAENRRRMERVEQTKTEEFPSPSTYYFSDECSSTLDNERTSNDHSPKYSAYNRNDLPVCAECKNYIKDMILQAIGKSFHPECFRCCECRKSLDGVPFAVNDSEQVYCMADYEKLYVPICGRCKMPIKPSNAYGQIVRVVAMDQEYHISCYSCESCGLQLTNEENKRCYPINDTLLCRKCNMQWQQLGGSISPLTDL